MLDASRCEAKHPPLVVSRGTDRHSSREGGWVACTYPVRTWSLRDAADRGMLRNVIEHIINTIGIHRLAPPSAAYGAIREESTVAQLSQSGCCHLGREVAELQVA